jgi:hypothetical protein
MPPLYNAYGAKLLNVLHNKLCKEILVFLSSLSHVIKSARRRLAIFFFVVALFDSLESPPSNLLKATRKPDVLVLSEIRG